MFQTPVLGSSFYATSIIPSHSPTASLFLKEHLMKLQPAREVVFKYIVKEYRYINLVVKAQSSPESLEAIRTDGAEHCGK